MKVMGFSAKILESCPVEAASWTVSDRKEEKGAHFSRFGRFRVDLQMTHRLY